MNIPTIEELKDCLKIPEIETQVYRREDNLPKQVNLKHPVRYRKGSQRGKWDRHG